MTEEVEGWEAVQGIPGMTYRKFDYWCSRGYIHCSSRRFERSGFARAITWDEVRVITLMAELTSLGVLPETAAPLARTLALGITATFGGFQIRRTA